MIAKSQHSMSMSVGGFVLTLVIVGTLVLWLLNTIIHLIGTLPCTNQPSSENSACNCLLFRITSSTVFNRCCSALLCTLISVSASVPPPKGPSLQQGSCYMDVFTKKHIVWVGNTYNFLNFFKAISLCIVGTLRFFTPTLNVHRAGRRDDPQLVAFI